MIFSQTRVVPLLASAKGWVQLKHTILSQPEENSFWKKIFGFFHCGIKTQKKIQTKWNKIERVGEICGNWHLWPNQPVMAFNATHKVPYHIFRPVGTPNPVDMGLWGDLSEEGKVYKVPPVHFLGCVMAFRFRENLTIVEVTGPDSPAGAQ